jgi:anti-sigma B factor antagonist
VPRSYPTFQLEEELVGGVVVIHVAGEVDLLAAPAVVDRLQAARERGPALVALDCALVTFVDSKLTEAIFREVHQIRAQGGDVAVAVADDYVRRVFDVLGLDSLVEIHRTWQSAARSLTRR